MNYKPGFILSVHWQPTCSRCIYKACIYWSLFYLDFPSEQLSKSSRFEEVLLFEIKFIDKKKKTIVYFYLENVGLVSLGNSKLMFVLRTSNFLGELISRQSIDRAGQYCDWTRHRGWLLFGELSLSPHHRKGNKSRLGWHTEVYHEFFFLYIMSFDHLCIWFGFCMIARIST